ncbi:MAG: hypothetical protein MJA30_15050, partial [Cytophagales bacterium]|nr:hypothetical protein [Cytophagales bacterium]
VGPKENETKEKGASNQAHFPFKTRCPVPTGRLPKGLKWTVLFPDVSPPYASWIFNNALFLHTNFAKQD